MSSNIRASTINNGNTPIRVYDIEGINYGAEHIKHYVLIDTGIILSGQSKVIDLTLLPYQVALTSIWTLSADNPNRGGTTVHIVDANDVNRNLHTFELDADCSCMTLPFVVLDHRYKLKISPDVNVENILIYAMPVYRTHYHGITNLAQ